MRIFSLIPVLLLSGCAACDQPVEPVGTEAPDTTVIDRETNKIVYQNGTTQIDIRPDGRTEVCDVERIRLEESWKFFAVPVPVWATTSWTHTQSEDVFEGAKHIHLRQAAAQTAAGVPAGRMIRFISGGIPDEPVLFWANAAPDQYDIWFGFDGSQDLAPFVKGNEITLEGAARVQSPTMKTYLQIWAEVDIWKNCELR